MLKRAIKMHMEPYKGQYPLANPPEYGDSDYRSRGGMIINGSEALFTLLACSRIDPSDETTADNIQDLENMMKEGRLIDPPTLYVDGNQVVKHDGRHRAAAFGRVFQGPMPILILDIQGRDVSQLTFLIKEQQPTAKHDSFQP